MWVPSSCHQSVSCSDFRRATFPSTTKWRRSPGILGLGQGHGGCRDVAVLDALGASTPGPVITLPCREADGRPFSCDVNDISSAATQARSIAKQLSRGPLRVPRSPRQVLLVLRRCPSALFLLFCSSVLLYCPAIRDGSFPLCYFCPTPPRCSFGLLFLRVTFLFLFFLCSSPWDPPTCLSTLRSRASPAASPRVVPWVKPA